MFDLGFLIIKKKRDEKKEGKRKIMIYYI